MTSKETVGYYILALAGITLFATGILLIIVITEPLGLMKSLPFVLIGIGAGSAGGGLGGVINHRMLQKNPRLSKEKKINAKDERSTLIVYKAKAAAYSITMAVFPILIIFLALVQAEVYITLVLCGAYLLILLLYGCLLFRYNKEL